MLNVRTLFRLCVAALLSANSSAVVLYETSDPEHNTTMPQGELADSGWDLQGEWGAFLGTPIAPNYFITAAHVGGEVGQEFWLNGVRHVTRERFLDSGSDLAIWRATPRFQKWALLYEMNDEVGKRLVVIGRGTQRGSAVQVTSVLGAVTKGWQWGVADARKRWGENVIESIVDADGNPHSVLVTGTVAVGSFLRATFDANAGPNEAHLTGGDSGGAVFVNDGTGWKLAGINLAVDGPYSLSATGPGFFATIFDEGGLYKFSGGSWVLTADLPSNQAGAFYATRISGRLSWIESIINQALPEPVLQWSHTIGTGFVDDLSAEFDPVNMVIKTSLPADRRFYRLRADEEMEITALTRDGDFLLARCRYR